MASTRLTQAFGRNERQIPAPPPLIGVVGPIGAGKSTLAAALAERLNLRLFAERVDDNPFFERFAVDPSTWAFYSQLAFMLNAVDDAIEARRSGCGAVIERPVLEMHAIFVRDQLRSGIIDTEDEMLLRKVTELGIKVNATPDLIVGVTARPAVLHERINLRGRPGEQHYSLEYIKRLNHAYAEWLDAWPGPVVIVDSELRDFRKAAVIDELAIEVEAALSAK